MGLLSWLRLLAIGVGVVALPLPAAVAETEIAAALRDFTRSAAVLVDALGKAEPVAVSPRRAEVRAEHGKYLYAAVATDRDLARHARDFLPFDCRIALIRDRMMPLVQINKDGPHRDALVETTLEIAAGEMRLRRVEDLRTSDVGPWRAHACRIRGDDITALIPPDRVDSYLAQASYRLAKTLIASGIKNGVLELLKNTRKDPSVHKNAVALMVPLAAEANPDLAARLEREALDLDAIDDTDALLHYAAFALSQGQWMEAGDAFERCLILKPKQPVCTHGLMTADAGSEAESRFNAVRFRERVTNE